MKRRFHHLYANHNIFITNQGINNIIITYIIDDLNIFAPYRNGIISCIKSELTTAFKIGDIAPLTFYMRFKVIRN